MQEHVFLSLPCILERLMTYYGIFWLSHDHTPGSLVLEQQGKKNQGLSKVQHESLASTDVYKSKFS